MFSYESFLKNPNHCRILTGLSLQQFQDLYKDFAAAHARHRQAATHTKRKSQPLQRAAGAGRRHSLSLDNRLLLTLVWLRLYPTYALLGLFFSLDRSNAWHNVQDVLEVLETLADFPFEKPAADRKALGSLDQVLEQYPEVKIIVDAKEQPCRRPGEWQEQKRFYSGQKKRHTLKTQIVCRPSGRIGAVSRSAAGCVHDLKVLRCTKVLDNLDAGEGAMLDKGYVGIEKEHPELKIVMPKKKPKGGELTRHERLSNRRISRSRVVVEHVMAQLNQYGVLKQVFRSVHGRHDRVIRVVAMLVDRRMAEKPLKRGVAEVGKEAQAA